ncbi:ammonium transporter [soil metagenome]
MQKLLSCFRSRQWMIAMVVAIGLIAVLSHSAMAQEAAPSTAPAAAPAIDPRAGAAALTSPEGVAINIVWTLVAGFLVMFMQAGFALVETGLCRAKNAAHVMSMNFLVYALGMTGFFICGYALMCGGAGKAPATINTTPGNDSLNAPFVVHIADHDWTLFGTKGFFLSGNSYDASALTWFLFMMVFMDTTATIPTGALAERWKMSSFFIFSLFIGGFLYPIYGGWLWGGGWLSQLGQTSLGVGALDYAGSSVVHMQGGVLALVCAWLLGPRIGKYDEKGNPKPLLGHNIPMVILGTFILAFGWFGFNAGSSLAADGRIGVVAVNTMLASASGALASCLYMWCIHSGKKPDPSMMCNGMLAGLVAITAPCAYVAPWGAFVIGLIAGVLVVWSVFFFEKIGIDDPVGAISVHGVNGAFGLLCVGIFADGSYGPIGFLYGEHKFNQFGAQFIAMIACFLWNVIAGGLIFFLIGKVLGSNRVSPEMEIAGLDIPEMGAPGYPEYITPVLTENVPASEVAAAKAQLGL